MRKTVKRHTKIQSANLLLAKVGGTKSTPHQATAQESDSLVNFLQTINSLEGLLSNTGSPKWEEITHAIDGTKPKVRK